MSYLRYLCYFAVRGVQHILCCVLVLISSDLCIPAMLPFSPQGLGAVSLDCPFWIAHSVFISYRPLLQTDVFDDFFYERAYEFNKCCNTKQCRKIVYTRSQTKLFSRLFYFF